MNETPSGPGRPIDRDLPGDPGRPGGDVSSVDREELDRRLRRAFSDARPPGAPETLRASLGRLPSSDHRPPVGSRWATARGPANAAIVIIVVAVVGALVMSRLPDPAASPPPTDPLGSPPVVIPWVDATPPPAPGRPTPRPVPPSTRACTPDDVDATAGWEGATGSMAGGISVTNVSSSDCVIDGPPKLVVIKAGTTTMETTYSTAEVLPGGTDPPGAGILEPGDQGGWWLYWTNWCGQDLVPTTVVVTLPDGIGPVVEAPGSLASGSGISGRPRCDAPGSPSSLTVAAFEYLPPEPALVAPQPASVTITAPSSATAGQDLRFTVALTNLGDEPAPFDPCPTYSEDLLVAGVRLKPPADREYALNCSGIGSALDPGATIVLEMLYPVPSSVPPGPAELIWSMDPGGPFDTGAFDRVAIDIVR